MKTYKILFYFFHNIVYFCKRNNHIIVHNIYFCDSRSPTVCTLQIVCAGKEDLLLLNSRKQKRNLKQNRKESNVSMALCWGQFVYFFPKCSKNLNDKNFQKQQHKKPSNVRTFAFSSSPLQICCVSAVRYSYFLNQ